MQKDRLAVVYKGPVVRKPLNNNPNLRVLLEEESGPYRVALQEWDGSRNVWVTVEYDDGIFTGKKAKHHANKRLAVLKMLDECA